MKPEMIRELARIVGGAMKSRLAAVDAQLKALQDEIAAVNKTLGEGGVARAEDVQRHMAGMATLLEAAEANLRDELAQRIGAADGAIGNLRAEFVERVAAVERVLGEFGPVDVAETISKALADVVERVAAVERVGEELGPLRERLDEIAEGLGDLDLLVKAVPIPPDQSEAVADATRELDGLREHFVALVERVAAVEARPQPPEAPDVEEIAEKVAAKVLATRGDQDDALVALVERVAAVERAAQAVDVEEIAAAVIRRLPPASGPDFDVLPAIDFTRSYPRGTLARHAGGMWRAHANTDGERGWECLWNGIEAIEIQPRGERTFAVVARLSDGATFDHEVALPVLIDRGVYKSDKAYQAGDGVSFGGSFWIAQVDTGDRPGTSEAWRLAVKKGRDSRRVGND